MLEDLVLPRRADRVCLVETLARGMNDNDAATLRKVADDKAWPINTLCNELNKRGISISAPTIKRHRSRICACGDA